jgi:mRNA interferase MazF
VTGSTTGPAPAPAADASGAAAASRCAPGDIWWVDFDPTQGSEIRKSRPAVVITADGLNRARRTVVVVPLSTGPQPRPPIIVATPSAGTASVAICDQVRAVDKRRLGRNDGRLSREDLRAVEDCLRRVLEL